MRTVLFLVIFGITYSTTPAFAVDNPACDGPRQSIENLWSEFTACSNAFFDCRRSLCQSEIKQGQICRKDLQSLERQIARECSGRDQLSPRCAELRKQRNLKRTECGNLDQQASECQESQNETCWDQDGNGSCMLFFGELMCELEQEFPQCVDPDHSYCDEIRRIVPVID